MGELKDVGALWKKEGAKGVFLSGEINKEGFNLKVMVFPNKKAKDSHPDYRIVMREEDLPAKNPASKLVDASADESFDGGTSIPF